MSHCNLRGISWLTRARASILIPPPFLTNPNPFRCTGRWSSQYSASLLGSNQLKLCKETEGSRRQDTTFHATWLRRNDPNRIHPTSGQREPQPDLLLRRIQQVQVVPNNSHTIKTSPPKGSLHPIGGVYHDHADTQTRFPDHLLQLTWDDGTSSSYDPEWLWKLRYDTQSLHSAQQKYSSDTSSTLRANETLFTIKYDSLLQSSQSVLQLLHAVVEQGAALVKGTPTIHHHHDDDDDGEYPVARIGRLLSGGTLSHGHLYGDVFHVRSVPKPNNIANTSKNLNPHQDMAYYESPPGLQLLHCVQNSQQVVGGESVLIDALAAASELQRLCPEQFETLTTAKATFLKQRDGADMVYRRTHIRTDTDDSVLSVHWSPPFEGPLNLPSDQVEGYYVAHSVFQRMLDNALPSGRLIPQLDKATEESLVEYAQTFTWEHKLEPGEILIFNNQRMLHGRRSFRVGPDGGRHLIGCYTNIDDTLNEFRLLRRKHGSHLGYRNIGNGSGSVW